MGDFSLSELSKQLSSVEETGVSFAGKSQNWSSKDKVSDLISEIEKCPNLTYLDLAGNTLGIEAAEEIGKALEKHPEFKKALWKDLFTGRLKTEIPQALKALGRGLITAGAQITELDCSDNALGPNGMVGLEDLIRSKACYSLQELKLNNCGLGIDGGKMLARALLDCHRKSTEAGTPLSLKVFIAGRNRLENEGAIALSKFFATVKTLEHIAIPQNGIYHPGIAALSKGLKENVNMRVLNLNDNIIQVKGAATLAEAIVSLQKLREINFGDCLLKTDGAIHIADALHGGHDELEILNLESNEIKSNGGLSIAEAMINKNNLCQLVLNLNEFGSNGKQQIREAMQDTVNPSALGPLDEDDSEEEEEEEEDYDDNEDNDSANEDTEEDDSTYSHDESDDENLDANFVTAISNKSLNTTFDGSFTSNNSVLYTGEELRPNTVETFCKTPNPSVKLFTALQETDKVKAFRDFLSNFKDEEYLVSLVHTALKCAALSQESSEALQVAEALVSDSFDHGQKTNQTTRVKNFYLIQLALLKSEDKSFKPTYNLKACQHAFKEIMDKVDTIPMDTKQTFKLFLERFVSP